MSSDQSVEPPSSTCSFRAPFLAHAISRRVDVGKVPRSGRACHVSVARSSAHVSVCGVEKPSWPPVTTRRSPSESYAAAATERAGGGGDVESRFHDEGDVASTPHVDVVKSVDVLWVTLPLNAT